MRNSAPVHAHGKNLLALEQMERKWYTHLHGRYRHMDGRWLFLGMIIFSLNGIVHIHAQTPALPEGTPIKEQTQDTPDPYTDFSLPDSESSTDNAKIQSTGKNDEISDSSSVILTAIMRKIKAKGQSFFKDYPTTHTFNTTFGLNTSGTGFEPYRSQFQQCYDFDSRQMSAFCGVQLAKSCFDFTCNSEFWLLQWSRLRMGPGLRYHLNVFDTIAVSNDFFAGLYLDWRPALWFGFSANTQYFFRGRTIQAIKNAVPFLVNHSIAFGMQFTAYLPYQFSLYLQFNSYEQFRYNVLCAPSLIVGVRYQSPFHVILSAEFAARYIDIFTLSGRFDNSELRFTMGYRL